MCFMLLLSVTAMAQSVTFEWDLSLDDGILGASGGYRLYQGTVPGIHGTIPVATVAAGVSTATIPRPGLGVYYYVVTAFSSNAESDKSNEVSIAIRPRAPHLKSAVQVAIGPIKAPDNEMALRVR